MIRNIIFDWSGTLSDDFSCTHTANMAVFRRLGLAELSPEQFRREFTLPYMEFYERYTETPKQEIDRIFDEELSAAPEQELYAEVKEALAGLREKGVPLAILSTCVKDKLVMEMQRFGIEGYFADVRGGVYDKALEIPSILEANGWRAEETAFVGDMTHDIEAGNKAGVISVAITRGYQAREKLEACGPRHVVADLEQLAALAGGESVRGSE